MAHILCITIFLAGFSLILGSEFKITFTLLALSLLSATCIPQINPWYFDILNAFDLYQETVITVQLLIVAILVRHYTH